MRSKIILLFIFAPFLGYAQQITKKIDTAKVSVLDEVHVTAVQKYGEKKSDDIAKMPLKNIENPQVYSVVPKEIIKNQILLTNKEVINNAVGVVAFNNPTSAVTAWIRGFETRNAVRNGMATQFRAESDPINIERVEIVKGPSGTLYGANAVSLGGFINKVTKVPNEVQSTEVGLFVGNYDLMRLTVDVNKPLNGDKTALFRVNAAYSYQHSFQDIGYNKNITVAPGFLYKVNKKFEILAEGEFATIKNTQMPYPNLSGGHFKNFKDIPIAYNKYVGGDDVDAKTDIVNLFLKGTYKISSQWTSTSNVNYSTGFVDHSYQLYPRWITRDSIQRAVGLYSARKLSFIQFQQNFNGDVKVLGMRNRILLGLDYTRNQADLNYQYASYDSVGVNKDYPPITRARIDAILGAGTAGRYSNTEYNSSAYFSDAINVFKSLIVSLSGRLDHYRNVPSISNNAKQKDGYEQTYFSPKIGVVYQLFEDKVSVFGNYMNGFINQAPVTQPNGEQLVIKPRQAYQKEIGVKTQLLDKKIFTTLSFYKIDVSNAIWTDSNNFTRQSGGQTSKGFELELIAQFGGFSFIGGTAYNSNEFTNGDPSLIKKKVQGAPQQMHNLWMDYKFDHGTLNKFRVGFGGNYVSSVFWDTANTIIIPSYTVVNASILYEDVKWTAGLKLNNITNEKYWNSDAQPQMPTNVMGTLSFKF